MASRDCLRTRRMSAPCDVCGVRPEVLHIPTRARGRYCPEHCSVCRDGEDQKNRIQTVDQDAERRSGNGAPGDSEGRRSTSSIPRFVYGAVYE